MMLRVRCRSLRLSTTSQLMMIYLDVVINHDIIYLVPCWTRTEERSRDWNCWLLLLHQVVFVTSTASLNELRTAWWTTMYRRDLPGPYRVRDFFQLGCRRGEGSRNSWRRQKTECHNFQILEDNKQQQQILMNVVANNTPIYLQCPWHGSRWLMNHNFLFSFFNVRLVCRSCL